jgi:hypothetical protein
MALEDDPDDDDEVPVAPTPEKSAGKGRRRTTGKEEVETAEPETEPVASTRCQIIVFSPFK